MALKWNPVFKCLDKSGIILIYDGQGITSQHDITTLPKISKEHRREISGRLSQEQAVSDNYILLLTNHFPSIVINFCMDDPYGIIFLQNVYQIRAFLIKKKILKFRLTKNGHINPIYQRYYHHITIHYKIKQQGWSTWRLLAILAPLEKF